MQDLLCKNPYLDEVEIVLKQQLHFHSYLVFILLQLFSVRILSFWKLTKDVLVQIQGLYNSN